MKLVRMLAFHATALMVFAACGGPSPAPTAPPTEPVADPVVDPVATGVCEVDDAATETRLPRPPDPSCADPSWFDLIRRTCGNTEDPSACHQIASCMQLAATFTYDHALTAFYGLEVACDGGIADGCYDMAMLAEHILGGGRGLAVPDGDRGELVALMCRGYQRSCQLRRSSAVLGPSRGGHSVASIAS